MGIFGLPICETVLFSTILMFAIFGTISQLLAGINQANVAQRLIYKVRARRSGADK